MTLIEIQGDAFVAQQVGAVIRNDNTVEICLIFDPGNEYQYEFDNEFEAKAAVSAVISVLSRLSEER